MNDISCPICKQLLILQLIIRSQYVSVFLPGRKFLYNVPVPCAASSSMALMASALIFSCANPKPQWSLAQRNDPRLGNSSEKKIHSRCRLCYVQQCLKSSNESQNLTELQNHMDFWDVSGLKSFFFASAHGS